ncbi:odorant receptor 22c-like [Bombus vosnesenskii]|uniref:Odorant receptor n=1 Tax=Bombus vosnesenskii TaxID=207650 RepID=A0A6J3KDD1_9HYME|nr:odorant receptor 22c-like [Bombus vosnesenskii]
MLCFVCAPQTINLPMIASDSDLVIENLSTNITITLSLMKTIVIWFKGKSLRPLIKCMVNDWDTVMNETERETMVNIAIITRKTTMRSTLMVNIVVLAFLPARLSNMRYNDSALFFRGYFPYNTSISPNFELTMIGQFVATVYAANTYTAIDTFVVLLIFHVCGQLSNLRDDLQKIHSYDKEDVETKLRKIIQKHEYINSRRLANINHVVRTSKVRDNDREFFQHDASASNAGLHYSNMLSVLSNHYGTKSFEEEAMEYMIFQITFLLLYVVYVMLQLFLYCYMGEKLAAESTEIANTAYYAEWYNLPPKNARWLVIIMCRARSSPLQITAGRFYWFTLALYTQYLRATVANL